MKYVRIILAIICLALGTMTFAGYFLVIHSKGGAPLHDVFLALGFASLFIVGGIMALLNKYIGAWLIVFGCLLYIVAGLYNPIRLYCVDGITYIKTEFFINTAIRCFIAAGLLFVMYKTKLANVHTST